MVHRSAAAVVHGSAAAVVLVTEQAAATSAEQAAATTAATMIPATAAAAAIVAAAIISAAAEHVEQTGVGRLRAHQRNGERERTHCQDFTHSEFLLKIGKTGTRTVDSPNARSINKIVSASFENPFSRPRLPTGLRYRSRLRSNNPVPLRPVPLLFSSS